MALAAVFCVGFVAMCWLNARRAAERSRYFYGYVSILSFSLAVWYLAGAHNLSGASRAGCAEAAALFGLFGVSCLKIQLLVWSTELACGVMCCRCKRGGAACGCGL